VKWARWQMYGRYQPAGSGLGEAVGGMGVPATRATTADEFMAQFRAAVSQAGPTLIEAVIE